MTKTHGQKDPALDPRAKETLSTLFSLVKDVRKDVDQYSSRVSATSQELSSLLGAEHGFLESVVSAVQSIVNSNESLQSQLQLADEKLLHQRQQIETYLAQARTDPLTGLPNRRAFEDFLRQNLARRERQQDPLTLVLVDLDRFKNVNDQYGHLAGDAVLRGIARVISATLRDMDLLCRIGGEEFAGILPGASCSGATNAAERVRCVVAASSFPFESDEVEVTVSIGVAEAMNGDSLESVLKRADEALYQSKSAGRDCVHIHDGSAIHGAPRH